MKLPSSLSFSAPGMNMTPMIDVVFLLIIFFIVSSSLIRQEVSMEIELPQAKTGRLPEETGNRETRKIMINIPEEGKVFIGTQPIDPADLRHFFALQSQHPKKQEDIEIHIRAARQVPFRQIEPILHACGETGFWKFSFAVVDFP